MYRRPTDEPHVHAWRKLITRQGLLIPRRELRGNLSRRNHGDRRETRHPKPTCKKTLRLRRWSVRLRIAGGLRYCGLEHRSSYTRRGFPQINAEGLRESRLLLRWFHEHLRFFVSLHDRTNRRPHRPFGIWPP